jgi:diacylglycerol kinase (ATP)
MTFMKTLTSTTKSFLKTRIKAFTYAWTGLRSAFTREQPVRFHTLFFVFAITGGLILNLGAFEWMLVLICSGLVFVSELFNSAIEALCDVIIPDEHPRIKYIKDISAGAVLLSAITAVSIAVFIVVGKTGPF